MSDYNREEYEAIEAGERALKSLNRAYSALSSAGNWGIWDILRGKTITNLIKHSKIERAKDEVMEARLDIQRFTDELNDIKDLHIDIGTLDVFVDFFFDGFFADIYVQSKIHKAKEQVKSAINEVERILKQLR